MRRLVDHVGLRRVETQRPSSPKGTVVFAIGDIHGRVDLLVKMHQQILSRCQDLPATTRKAIVYLGDYTGSGPDSAGVIDTLISAPLPGFESAYLLGDNDLALISFLKGEADFLRWAQNKDEKFDLPTHYLVSKNVIEWLYENGGLQTLRSYGVETSIDPTPQNIAAMRVQLLRKIPTDHLSFLENLRLSESRGDYFFVHAGIDPRRNLSNQNPSDLLMIEEPFLNSKKIYEKVIVHGHTPYLMPVIRTNRIGIGTQPDKTGVLSCLMVNGERVGILQTSA